MIIILRMGNKDLKISVHNNLDFEINSPFVMFSHWNSHTELLIFKADAEKYRFGTIIPSNKYDWEKIESCPGDTTGYVETCIEGTYFFVNWTRGSKGLFQIYAT